jgi:hypothetical protein
MIWKEVIDWLITSCFAKRRRCDFERGRGTVSWFSVPYKFAFSKIWFNRSSSTVESCVEGNEDSGLFEFCLVSRRWFKVNPSPSEESKNPSNEKYNVLLMPGLSLTQRKNYKNIIS